MATYKVIQDIEAEDKLLGPLTLRQFIYAAIVIVIGFIIFKTMASGIWYVAVPLGPVMAFFGLLAAPFGHDQSSEVWMLAKVRFWIKSRLRIWDQDGLSDLVTITAPKPRPNLTDGLSQTEVRSRLEALATTIDSRGWAIKELGYDPFATGSSDRLVAESEAPQDNTAVNSDTVVDVMDEATNPTAQNFNKLMAASEQSHRQQIASSMQKASETTTDTKAKPKAKAKPKEDDKPAKDFWFMKEDRTPTDPGISIFDNPAIVAPGATSTPPTVQPAADPTTAEERLIEQIREKEAQPLPIMYHQYREELVNKPQPTTPKVDLSNTKLPPIITKKQLGISSYPSPPAASPELPPTGIINVAKNSSLVWGNDLNLATISREANKETVHVDTKGDEVVIDLHYKGNS